MFFYTKSQRIFKQPKPINQTMTDTITTTLPATIGRRNATRRCGFCKEGTHTEPFCELAKSRAEQLLDRLTSIRYTFVNRDDASIAEDQDASIPDMLHTHLNEMTVTECRILSRRLQIEAYSDSLQRRDVYTYEELHGMTAKRRYVTLYMQYFIYDNYNLETVAGQATRDETMADETGDSDSGIIPIQNRIEPFLQTCHDKKTEMDCPICLNVYLKRDNVQLNCGHSLCNACIHSYLIHSNSDNYKCCLCRAKIVDITYMDATLYNNYKTEFGFP
jgi:hypothetical protein